MRNRIVIPKSGNLHDTLSVTVNKFYTTVDGTIIDKNTLPVNLRKKLPVYLIDGFGMDSGFAIAQSVNPVDAPLKFIRFFVRESGFDFTQFSGLNDVSSGLNAGDLVFLYADDELNPNFFMWVVQTAYPKPLSGIIKNIPNLSLNYVRLFVDQMVNYSQQLTMVKTSSMGDYRADKISPYISIDPMRKDVSFSEIHLQGCLDKYTSFLTYLPFEANQLTVEFKLHI